MARIYGKVLKRRIEEQFEESEEQNGFRAWRSCIEGIFALKNLSEKRVMGGRPIHLVFVNLEKAYDTVPLRKVWPCLQEAGIDKAYINTVKRLYSNNSSSLKMGNGLSQD